jgi:hypothetical protein
MNRHNSSRNHSPDDRNHMASDRLLAATPFSAEERARLLRARRQFQEGQMHEWVDDYKRLRFARWLYEHGSISEGDTG